MTAFQVRLLAVLAKFPNGQAEIVHLADSLRSNNVAVASSARALERAGRVGIISASDQIGAGHIVCLRRSPMEGTTR